MGHKDSSPMLKETPLMESEKKKSMSKVVDMSPFFLFEAVGDSEGDFDHRNMRMMKMVVVGKLGDVHSHDDEDEDEDEDDAESCSHGVWDRTSHVNGNGAHDSFRGLHGIHDGGDDDVMRRESSPSKASCHDGVGGNVWKGSQRKKDYSRYDDDDHHHHDVNNKSASEVMSTANSHASRNSSCVESSEGKKMTEKERSRLFWETCLAS